MKVKKELIEAFYKWFTEDQHNKREYFYDNTIKLEHLSNLSKEDFVKFIFDFTYDGGKIQSGGERFASQFIEIVKTDYEIFRSKILQPFSPGFDLDEWLKWADGVKFFSPSTATIFLNRVNKGAFVIVNNKSIGGLRQLGYKIPSGTTLKQYKSIKAAEAEILLEFPELKNFYRVDALMHYIVANDEGQKLLVATSSNDYFNLLGFTDYSGDILKRYDPLSPAARWWLDTREKLEYLVGLLKERLPEDISINYSERPNKQGGQGQAPNLKEYILTGFSPNGMFPNGELFVKLAFHSLGKEPKFDIELDVNYKLEVNPFNAIIEPIKNRTRKTILVNTDFPKDWDSLILAIQDHVKFLIKEFRDLSNKPPIITLAEAHSPNFNSNSKKMHPLNTILYGPPGTGKTYRTIDHALAIIEKKDVKVISDERERNEKLIKERFDNYVNSGRIAFCTFHQSMGYEDFVEGIKPLPPTDDTSMQYDVLDGIFKKLNTDALYHLAAESGSEDVAETLDFSEKYDLFIEWVQEKWARGETVALETKSGGEILLKDLSRNNHLIFSHPGSERPVLVSKPRLAELSSGIHDLSEVNNIDKHFRNIIGGMDSTAYWASLNAIRNFQIKTEQLLQTKPDIKKDVKYEAKKAAILNFKIEAEDLVANNYDNFVLIIDEINRGNIAQIFGELITLIEEDKRKGCKNSISLILPYSGKPFEVAPNLYIIGTMNTADRSVEALDTALRRRFSFVEMEPLCEILKEDVEGINLNLMLKTINERLEILLDKDHTIGHAWLMEVENLSALKQKFENRIIPLLREFFYNEPEKIGLVLNEDFFQDDRMKKIEFSRYKLGADIAAEHKNKKIQRLKPASELTKEDFISIYMTNILTEN